MPLTTFEQKKEDIKADTRANKFSVWYMYNEERATIRSNDQANGQLFTAVENAIIKYYGERTALNGKTVNKFMGAWNNLSSTSPWFLSVKASDFDTFPTLSQQYLEMNTYKLAPQVYKNGESGSGNGGIIILINNLTNISDQLLNGYIFSLAAYSENRWQASSGTTITLENNPSPPPTYLGIKIIIPGQNTPLLSGRYYIEANGVNWLGQLSPVMIYNVATRSHEWQGYYTFVTDHEEGGNSIPDWSGGPHPAIVRNYYIWSNSQRTTDNDWWSNKDGLGWPDFPAALTSYYNSLTNLINTINEIPPILIDIIDYYKATTSIVGSTTPNWELLGGTGTWDNPGDIAFGWTETNAFYTEVTTGGGSGSWVSQLSAHLPASPTLHGPGYSDSEIGAVNALTNDFNTKINNRMTEIENNILGQLSPAAANGSFSALRAIRYLWVDARINKSGGTLVNRFSNDQGIDILTKKANLLNDQLDSLRIPDIEREPRTIDVDCSRMEFTDRIRITWKMVMQATGYDIYRFDAGTGDAARLYNMPDGPPDNLFVIIDTIDAIDSDGLPVTRYDDTYTGLETEHYYYYKIKVHHDGKGFPPPYNGSKESTNPENATESFLSLNFYDSKVWRAVVSGNLVILDGFLNSGALRG